MGEVDKLWAYKIFTREQTLNLLCFKYGIKYSTLHLKLYTNILFSVYCIHKYFVKQWHQLVLKVLLCMMDSQMLFNAGLKTYIQLQLL